MSGKKGLKELLNESGGVRVYRGGIRVYDYGERGNDWLGLGGRRVNVPTKRLSNNLIVGAVTLDVKKSANLALSYSSATGYIRVEEFCAQHLDKLREFLVRVFEEALTAKFTLQLPK